MKTGTFTSNFISYSLAVSVILALVLIAGNYFQNPAIYTEIKILNEAIYPGDTLRYSNRLSRFRSCKVVRDRSIINTDEHELVWSERTEGVDVHLGRDQVLYPTLKLPDDIRPGHYVMRNFAYTTCLLGVYNIQLPEAKFEVLPRK